MEYKDIIKEILEVYKINASDLAQKIDVQRSSISHIISGRNNPSLDVLIKVKHAFPELRWDYILLGEKPMTQTEKYQIDKRQERDEKVAVEPDLFSPPPTPPMEGSRVKTDDTSNQEEVMGKTKSVIKIVWFYDDNSFQVFEK